VKVDSVVGDMRYVRKNNGSFGIEYRDFDGFRGRINARYIGHRFEDNWIYDFDYTTFERIPYETVDGEQIRPGLVNEDILEHPDFLVVDISFSYTLMEKYSFNFEIQNLFDENYTEKDGYYMPGRTMKAGFVYSF
jgi:vitamin B12 transporter